MGTIMILFSRLLQYVGIFFLLWGVSACSEKQQAVENKPDIVQKEAEAQEQALNVYKSPTCGCCGGWVEHIEAAGFDTAFFHPTNLNQIKIDNGIPPRYQSCHTAISRDGYVFEGHIPAKYIRQFLKNPPSDAIGLAVPAMPVGSPGMEMVDRFSPYQVLLLKKGGGSEIFARVEVQEEQYQ
jgi:hypothetical protein